ncbi:MAG: hypothetical protein HOA17_09140 [Candidatus Melainabacteria bacterium]|jgi:hypothetical protein|nr:hypothetical protein [Candidatus Melainabacteria bacterium]
MRKLDLLQKSHSSSLTELVRRTVPTFFVSSSLAKLRFAGCLLLTIVLISQILCPISAQAFFWNRKKKNQPAPVKVLINEEVLINGKFKGSHGGDSVLSQILELRLAIHIPRDNDSLTITTLYDEASENPIETITWLREGKKGKSYRAKPYKTESLINKRLEEMAISYNPSLAYDRISENKHVINKVFHFKQSEAIGERDKEIAHFLDLDMPGNKGPRSKRIRIDNKLYYREAPIATIPEPVKLKKSRKQRKQESQQRAAYQAQQMQLRTQRQATLEAEHGQEMADLQYAINQVNGFNDPDGSNNLDPQQFRQSQIEQQLDAFGPGEDSGEDIF